MMPAAQLPNVDVSMAARQYVSAGWVLVPIAKGSKGPRHTGWNLQAQCIDDDARASRIRGGIGLAHAYSRTACIDLDDLSASALWLFEEHGIDLKALLDAPDAVQILSGRENRAKLLYRLPAGLDPLVTVRVPDCGLELRCATREGKTVQDVLPPTIHPTTLLPYQWAGAGDWHALPDLPGEILAVWQVLAENVDPARPPSGVPEGDPEADPLVAHLEEGGWVKARRRDGTRHIRCPFESEHTTASGVGDTSYFPALTGGYAQGHFKCLHSHCEGRDDREFMAAVGFNPLGECLPIVDDGPAEVPLPSFARDKNGRIEATINNMLVALHSEVACGWKIGEDSFRGEIMLSPDGGQNWRALTDNDYVTLRSRLERFGFKPIGRELVRDAVAKVAEDLKFDSGITWIESLRWDGVPRIDTFLPEYFGTQDTPYTRAVGAYLWTALAGRMLAPGIKADMVPVMVGAQGAGKSSSIAAIVPHPDFFSEMNLMDDEDRVARTIRGRLVIELAELKGMRRTEIEHIKSTITRTHESWRPVYKEMKIHYARRCLFIGSTNDGEFLDDETGSRRWLPFHVGSCDAKAITRDRLQLWAEARVRFLIDGLQWEDAERLARDQHHHHRVADSWEDTVREWLDQVGPDGFRNRDRRFLRARDVLKFAFNYEDKHITRREEIRASKILRAIGYERTVVRDGNKTFKAWVSTETPF